jgi:hypothetical protein
MPLHCRGSSRYPATVRFLNPHPTLGRLSLLVLGLAACGTAVADPGYYLMTPYSVPGQAALDLRYWTVKSPGQEATLWPELGLRYGFSSRWTSEILASFIGDSLSEQKLSSWNWQNTYLLTQGQHAFDLAVHAQLIRNVGYGNALEVGPVLQTEIGSTQLNLNWVFDHSWVAGSRTELKYQWQVLQRLRPGLRVGLQGFGELGPWNHWSDTPSHRAGPVLRAALWGNAELQAAYLWGKTYGSRGDMFSAQLVQPF